jgi:lipoate-protein ligase B
VSEPPLAIAWLGRTPYRGAWALQERLRDAILDGRGAETLLLLEHDPVITLGRFADASHVLLDEAALAARGIERVASSRGGDVTYHGPGQLVAYPVVRLERGVVAHVAAMAQAVIEVLGARGIDAAFRRERPGVWVGARKICAFGVHVRRRVAIHGLALNVTTPLERYAAIVPCGLRDAGVTSIAEEMHARSKQPPAPPALAELALELGAALARQLRRAPAIVEPSAIGRCFPDPGP